MSCNNLCIDRLMAERKAWRKNHPYGFVAKPVKCANGVIDFHIWNCTIPYTCKSVNKQKSYFIEIVFSDQYPLEKPSITHYGKEIHPNSLKHWSPCTDIKMILEQIKKDLDSGNTKQYL